MSQAYFVSDIHLVDPTEPRALALTAFLRGLHESTFGQRAEKPTHLFLVGDIFDLWVGDHDYFAERFKDVVSAIRQLVNDGVEVHYFEGNHDLHLHEFWNDKVGARVHADAATFQLGSKKVRVEHGDLINLEDKGYLFLRKLLRSAPVTFLAKNLPEFLVKVIGERASRASRGYTSGSKSLADDNIRKLIRAHAERVVGERSFDLIVSGHVHTKDDVTFEMSGREIRSVNLGSWFDGPKAFVLDASGGRFIELSHHQ